MLRQANIKIDRPDLNYVADTDPGNHNGCRQVNSKLVRTKRAFLQPPSPKLLGGALMTRQVNQTMGYLSRHSICIVLQPISPKLPSIDLQYVQKCIMKDGSASFLLGIPTKHFYLAATAADMRRIKETRNATSLNHSVRFKCTNKIYDGIVVVDCAMARNLELTVNLSTRNDKNPSLAS
jgi:hypothetical protein